MLQNEWHQLLIRLGDIYRDKKENTRPLHIIEYKEDQLNYIEDEESKNTPVIKKESHGKKKKSKK
ncbi:hypothetical protein [Bacillus sp. FJAT-45037]|uniref:hypothetical protein n=1 Tax=Bacillus sp. FJAT-45037 TaxID=2011007 RepID=UPI000C234663|nr:hypothetical protein [Bacillus sp. FJAT-45037]